MMFEYYFNAFRNYVNFKGRARRSEYWYFVLTHVIAYIALTVIGALLNGEDLALGLFLLYAIGSLLPMLAVTVRRLHDIGKSGTMYFVRFIPIAGPIWLLVLLVTDGENGPNKYGPDPKDNGYSEFDEIGKTVEY